MNTRHFELDASLSRLAALVPPEYLRAALVTREHTGKHEQKIRQPIQVLRHCRANRFSTGEGAHAPLGAPCDGARQVAGRRRRSAARKNEFLQWRQRVIEA